MTTLYQEIVATCTEQEIADRNYHVIAANVNAQRVPKSLSKMMSARGVLESYADGPIAADAVLTKLEEFSVTNNQYASIVKRAIGFLNQPEGLDIGSAATQGLITLLGAGGVLTSDEATKLKALAPTTSNHATWQECQEALELGV